MKLTKHLWQAAFGMVLLSASSCSTPREIAYFQDFNQEDASLNVKKKVITLKPQDKLSIVVKSKDQQLSELFNLPIQTSRLGYTNGSGYSQMMSLYTIDSQGEVDIPVLGKVKIAGLTREQVAEKVKKSLTDANLVKDPVVTVEFDNLAFSVMGEVARPGQYAITRDRITILDALSQAGDLTIYGNRTNVMVLRQEDDGHQKIYNINLCSGYSVMASPVYYLQQNDVVYVSPNETKARQSTVNGNNVRSTSFWISLASLATSIGVLIKK